VKLLGVFQVRQPLYIEIANEIKRRIVVGIYPSGAQLPSEPELANEFGVSRGTLREALGILEKEGKISRKHGIGSFVETPAKVIAGIEKLESLVSTIRRAGFVAQDKVLSTYETTISPSIAEKLNAEPNSKCYVIESLRYADGIPVIYCYDILPYWLIKDIGDLQLRKNVECMVDYLKTYINIKPYNYVSNVTAVLAKDPVDKLLQVNRRTPLIKMEGVMYDENSNPVNYGRQYFRSDKYQFTLVRQ
jgi:GntR family transcriptional regulator